MQKTEFKDTAIGKVLGPVIAFTAMGVMLIIGFFMLYFIGCVI